MINFILRWWCGEFHDPKALTKEGPTYRCGVCGTVRVAPWASAGEVERWEGKVTRVVVEIGEEG